VCVTLFRIKENTVTRPLASLIIFLSASAAMACPNLTGLFQMADDAVIQYESHECTSLQRWNGFQTGAGEIVINPEAQTFDFGGAPVCVGAKCQYATSSPGAIIISLDYDGFVKTKTHGLCAYRSTKLSINGDNDLKSVYRVKNCDDGFQGLVTKFFKRLR
jgi:hypothetical protein